MIHLLRTGHTYIYYVHVLYQSYIRGVRHFVSDLLTCNDRRMCDDILRSNTRGLFEQEKKQRC